MLFDSPKDIVLGKVLFFSNILRFPGVNQSHKYTNTINFGYVPLLLKHKFFEDCSNTVFVL